MLHSAWPFCCSRSLHTPPLLPSPAVNTAFRAGRPPALYDHHVSHCKEIRRYISTAAAKRATADFRLSWPYRHYFCKGNEHFGTTLVCHQGSSGLLPPGGLLFFVNICWSLRERVTKGRFAFALLPPALGFSFFH